MLCICISKSCRIELASLSSNDRLFSAREVGEIEFKYTIEQAIRDMGLFFAKVIYVTLVFHHL